ncbi:hypothetical protein HYW76_02010 [Candidatus Pacearchaeota archaeon]|nr:hypothetical protein [Candidatus Pacearchaeota archaeon]
MNEDELKEEGLRGMKEFDLAWEEFFKDKPEPKNDEEEKKEQEEFHYWYNHVRKQSDTGKTPAEMYKEVYGKEPERNLEINSQEPSRMIKFKWDKYDDENFDEEYEEEMMKKITELADSMFDNGVWQNSKEEMKDMSKRESSKHMFRLGFFIHHKYTNEQMKELAKKLENMPKEEIQKLANSFYEDNGGMQRGKNE